MEEYARKELGLVNPEKVRFLKENFSPPEESSSPPPFIDTVARKLKSPIFKIVGQMRSWFETLYEKEEQQES